MKAQSTILLIISLLIFSISAFPWGFYGHKMVARNSVFILPHEMMSFYKKNLDQIVEGSIQPDVRRYVYDNEGPKHYIDLELYGQPVDSVLFLTWNEAVGKYGKDSLYSWGILPWSIAQTYHELTSAFKEKDPARIIRYSADLCHYAADANVPLHTTYNYNGQYTGQGGIHRLWESLIPESNAEHYSFWVGKAEYRQNINDYTGKTIINSNSKVDSVLFIDKRLTASFDEDKKYSFERRGKREIKQHSREYVSSYENLLAGMVERQMQASVKMTGDLWYSSWIEAGQPDLNNLNYSKSKISKAKERFENPADSLNSKSRSRLHNH